MIEYSAGIVTAYGSAVRAGYTGTYEDFCRQQAQYAQNASAVEQAKQTAVSASQTANQAKQDAQSASTTAQQSAQSAQGSAQSAGQSAQDAQTYAQSASASAGSAQQSAQSAQAVLESIPEDYSDLSEDVDKLKADLGAIGSKKQASDYMWNIGYIKPDGTNGTSTVMCRLHDFVHVSAGDVLVFDGISSYLYQVFFYSSNVASSYTGNTEFDDSVWKYTIENDCYIRLNVKNNPSHTMTADDRNRIAASIYFISADSLYQDVSNLDTRIYANATDIADIRADLNTVGDATPLEMSAGWIAVNKSIGTVIDITDITDSVNYSHSINECAEGDKYLISGTGGDGPRLWCFLDADKKIISFSNASLTAENLILTAPEDAAYLIVQSNDKTKKSYQGIPINVKVNGMTESIDTAVSSVEAVTDDNLGASIIKASNFTVKTQGITYTYNSEEQSVTLIKTSEAQYNYQALSTPVDFLVGKLTVGKTYRLHYRADIISGVPEIRMTIRKSDNSSALPSLILQDGVDGYVDFVATADMSIVSVFITFNTAVGACQIKYSDMYLCEVIGKTAVDLTARTDVSAVASNVKSNAYNMFRANSYIYKYLFAMLRTLKENISVTAFPAYTASGNKQGACTDGQYIYQCCGDAANYTYMSIIKYDIATKEIVSTTTFNGTPNFGHANDMTYDPVTGYLYVCTMLSNGSVIRIDSKDMSYVDTLYLVDGFGGTYAVWQLAFNRATRNLIVAVNTEYRIYDPDGNYIGAVPLVSPIEATAQGMETDGVYIYRVTYNPNCIDVCDMDGTRIKTYTLPISGEPEAMMCDWMGVYYISKYGTDNGQFYIADIMEQVN